MNYLLDTHTLLWGLMDTGKFSAKVKEILSGGNFSKFVSTVTFWEISLKYSLNKLKLKNKLPDEVPDAVVDMDFNILDLDPKVVSSYYQLPKSTHHKDPFDRMLIWQAIRGNIILISKDKSFSEYEKYGLSLLW